MEIRGAKEDSFKRVISNKKYYFNKNRTMIKVGRISGLQIEMGIKKVVKCSTLQSFFSSIITL